MGLWSFRSVKTMALTPHFCRTVVFFFGVFYLFILFLLIFLLLRGAYMKKEKTKQPPCLLTCPGNFVVIFNFFSPPARLFLLAMLSPLKMLRAHHFLLNV